MRLVGPKGWCHAPARDSALPTEPTGIRPTRRLASAATACFWLAGAVLAADEALGRVGVEEQRDSIALPLLNVLSKIAQRPELFVMT